MKTMVYTCIFMAFVLSCYVKTQAEEKFEYPANQKNDYSYLCICEEGFYDGLDTIQYQVLHSKIFSERKEVHHKLLFQTLQKMEEQDTRLREGIKLYEKLDAIYISDGSSDSTIILLDFKAKLGQTWETKGFFFENPSYVSTVSLKRVDNVDSSYLFKAFPYIDPQSSHLRYIHELKVKKGMEISAFSLYDNGRFYWCSKLK